MNTPDRQARFLSGTILLLAAAASSLTTQVAADTFGSGGNTFTMDFVNVGNPGNGTDSTGYGAVSYAYRMGAYEVSRDMITKANSVGGLGITLADMTGYGGNGVNRPVTGVSWFEAATFVNWLNTSKGHAPAYNFVGGNFALWSAGDAWTLGGQNLYRNKDAYYFLPSENEWYKAAYYTGTAYFVYPTGSDTSPAAVAGGTGAGTAVYDQSYSQGPADIANAGALSPYGTMGQGGNVWEWQESAWDGVNNSSAEYRGLRGDRWYSPGPYLASPGRYFGDPTDEVNYDVGFRVAAVPEPSAGVVVAAGLGGWLVLRRRRGCC